MRRKNGCIVLHKSAAKLLPARECCRQIRSSHSGTVITPSPGGPYTPVPIASPGVATIDSEEAVSPRTITMNSDRTANAACGNL